MENRFSIAAIVTGASHALKRPPIICAEHTCKFVPVIVLQDTRGVLYARRNLEPIKIHPRMDETVVKLVCRE